LLVAQFFITPNHNPHSCCHHSVFSLASFPIDSYPQEVPGVESDNAAASPVVNSEAMYQTLIGDLQQSEKTCEVMEVMGLTKNGVIDPEPWYQEKTSLMTCSVNCQLMTFLE
jgi:hypothetical protein